MTGLPFEYNVFIVACIAVVSKYNKTATVDQFVYNVFNYGKVTVLALSYCIGWMTFAWYLIIFAIFFVFLKVPDTTSKNIVYLNPANFNSVRSGLLHRTASL